MITFVLIVGFAFFLWSEGNRSETYRKWYLKCRTELEKVDPNNEVLAEIGERTSKKEKWEK